jgi:predicted DNA binding CopG/RHH family protein
MRKTSPKFRGEAQEAAWYATPQGRRQTEREYRKALKEGTLVESARVDGKLLERLMNQAKEKATRAISIRLPVADLERANAIAKEQGVGYQTVIKQILRRGLRKTG